MLKTPCHIFMGCNFSLEADKCYPNQGYACALREKRDEGEDMTSEADSTQPLGLSF